MATVEASPAGAAGRHLLRGPHRLPHVRVLAGRQPQPSACIVAGPSVKTSGMGGVRGFDGGQTINGRKRHIAVDTLGLVLRAIVQSAAIQERSTIPWLLDGIAEQFPRLGHAWLDQGYTGGGRQWIETHLGWRVDIVQHPRTWERGFRGVMDPVTGFRLEWITIKGKKGFQGVLPRRWVVEIILAQLTKPGVEAALAGWDHVADLHVIIGDHHPGRSAARPTPDGRAKEFGKSWSAEEKR